MTDTTPMTAPSLIHTANVFLPGCLGPVKRDVVLADDHQELVAKFEEATRQLDILASAIAQAGVDAGHITGPASLTGPQLLMILADMVTILHTNADDLARYHHLRDAEWPGGCQQIGIVHRDREAYWLTGLEADLAIDLDRAAPPPAPVMPPRPLPTPAEWKLSAKPIAYAERHCFEPRCSLCFGTGREAGSERVCWGDDIPF